MEYAYKRVGAKDFDEIVEAVEHAVHARGFVVQEFHDIRARLIAKGFPIGSLVIFEIGPGENRNNKEISLLMPCRINVYESGDDVIVAALRPTLFSAVFPEHELDTVAEEIEALVIGMVDDAVS